MRTIVLVLSVCAILIAPLAACSDQESADSDSNTYTIGILNTTARSENPIVDDVKSALAERGYVEGVNVTYLDPMVEGNLEARLEAVQTMLDAGVDIILVGENDAEAAHQLTDTVPLVLMSSLDPIGEGLVDSIARPGGNITGVFIPARDDRRLQYLRDAIPGLDKVYVPFRSDYAPDVEMVAQLEAVAPELGVDLAIYEIAAVDGLQQAWEAMPADVDAVFLGGDQYTDLFFIGHMADLNERNIATCGPLGTEAFPSIFLGYGIDSVKSGHQVARLVDQILQGTNPRDVPLEAVEFSLIISLVAAEALEIKVPDTILRQADYIVRPRSD